ncbi:MAG TPA: hypothetical protein VK151_08050 [Fluviicola sp.]|nr:hypothetical protein [Fluviicola sp.]
MKKLGITFIFALALFSTAVGQQYKTAIGVKGGFPYYGSLNLKHFFGASAGEFRLGGGRNTFFFQALYERNYALGQGFDWYWGVGGHLGFWNYGNGKGHYHHDHYYNSGSWGGLDGVLGIEYTFTEIPLNIALDAGPSFRLFPYTEVYFGGAIAARFAIK